MIEDTLRKFASAYLADKQFTEEIKNAYHETCWDTGSKSSLARYFDWGKESKEQRLMDYWQYCETTGEPVCEKCAKIYVAIMGRKLARKKLNSARSVITKHAIALLKKEESGYTG
jgi:hypothetical protein